MRIYPNLTVDGEFKSLGDQGHMGTLNDRQFSFLRSKGYQNSLADMMTSWLAFTFSPSELFSVGEPGVWFDPSDLSTLFQDTAGTQPVTTTGQSVGLMLDKSKGLVLGSEEFVSPTLGAGWSLSGGDYVRASGLTASSLSQAISSIAVRGIVVTFTVKSISGLIELRTSGGGSGFLNHLSITAAGSYRVFVRRIGVPDLVLTLEAIGSTTTATLSNISVKELPGNHAVQATTANRPIYGVHPFGGRRNLLVRTEEFENASWTKSASSVVADAGVAPNGAAVADRLVPNTNNDFHYMGRVNAVTSGVAYTSSFYAKADGYGFIRYYDPTTSQDAVYTLSGAGAITGNSGGVATITDVGGGWYRCTKTFTAVSTTQTYFLYPQNVVGSVSYAGDGTSGVYIWGAQLETGSTATAYQRVTDQYNVTEAGVPSVSYLFFDGVNDSMATPTITPGVDKAQVFVGVRKLSDAAVGMIAETSVDAGSNNGAFRLLAPGSAGYEYRQRGTLNAAGAAVTTGFAAPVTSILTGIGDIANDVTTLRVNGTQAATSSADQGTGNFLAYPLYIGARAGTSLFFNGHLYSLIVRFGPNLATGQISSTETWVAGKTGITI